MVYSGAYAAQQLRSWGASTRNSAESFFPLTSFDRQDELENPLAGPPDRYQL